MSKKSITTCKLSYIPSNNRKIHLLRKLMKKSAWLIYFKIKAMHSLISCNVSLFKLINCKLKPKKSNKNSICCIQIWNNWKFCYNLTYKSSSSILLPQIFWLMSLGKPKDKTFNPSDNIRRSICKISILWIY